MVSRLPESDLVWWVCVHEKFGNPFPFLRMPLEVRATPRSRSALARSTITPPGLGTKGGALGEAEVIFQVFSLSKHIFLDFANLLFKGALGSFRNLERGRQICSVPTPR